MIKKQIGDKVTAVGNDNCYSGVVLFGRDNDDATINNNNHHCSTEWKRVDSVPNIPDKQYTPKLNAIYVHNNSDDESVNAVKFDIDLVTLFMPDISFILGPLDEVERLARAVGYTQFDGSYYYVPCEMRKRQEPKIFLEMVANGEGGGGHDDGGDGNNNCVNFTLSPQEYVLKNGNYSDDSQCLFAFKGHLMSDLWWLGQPFVWQKCYQLGVPPAGNTWLAVSPLVN